MWSNQYQNIVNQINSGYKYIERGKLYECYTLCIQIENMLLALKDYGQDHEPLLKRYLQLKKRLNQSIVQKIQSEQNTIYNIENQINKQSANPNF